MRQLDLHKALEVATAAARAAGELLSKEFHRSGGPRHSGASHADVDEEAERVIREKLLAAFPDFSYVGEETGSRAGDPEVTWYVDPNDGTRSYVVGLRGAAVSIGLVHEGRPVLGVVFAPTAPDDGGDLITWADGEPLRRNGKVVERKPLAKTLRASDVVLSSQDCDRNSAANVKLCAPARYRAVPSIAYRLALVAAGEGEAAVSLNGPTHWDYAGGHALLRSVGGELFDERGEAIGYGGRGSRGGSSVFGAQPAVARELARRPWQEVRQPEAAQPEIALKWTLVRPTHTLKHDSAQQARAGAGRPARPGRRGRARSVGRIPQRGGHREAIPEGSARPCRRRGIRYHRGPAHGRLGAGADARAQHRRPWRL